MGLPTLSLSWDFTKINQRETYSSLNDAMAFVFFTTWRYIIDTMGWTVVYTCDGTTGPSSSSDHTDRLSSKTTCAHRGISTSTACSWGVAQDAGGAQYLFAYVGAGTTPTGDNLFYAAFSPTGAYVPASTATFPATATDQILVSNSLSWVGTGTTDRLLQIQASTDKKSLRLWTYSAGANIMRYFSERCSSTVIAGMGWTDPLVVGIAGSGYTGANAWTSTGSSIGSVAGTQGAFANFWAKIGGTVVNVGGGCEAYLGSTRMANGAGAFATVNPELNGGGPIVPLVFASVTTFAEGKLGNVIDAWFPFVNGITDNTWLGSSYNFMYFSTQIVPWDGVNPGIIA